MALPDGGAAQRAMVVAEATWLARDLINTPANDLGPAQLEAAVAETAARFGAEFRTIVGEDLLAANYPAVHAVGPCQRPSAAADRPALGRCSAPKVTLVGKGVCFDTGGLDIKPSSNMLLMKKDMGGAALMLALARCIMALDLPVRLRLLIPAVENSVGGRAFRPGDMLRMRSGTTVEITNTDAEGRLILADALAEADGEAPALLLDAATLTGAARVAVGPGAAGAVHPGRQAGRGPAPPRRQRVRPALAPSAARALSRLSEEPGRRPRQRQQQAVRRCRSPRPCSSRSSSGRRRPGRISTCSPGTTTADPVGRAAARPPGCARCWR